MNAHVFHQRELQRARPCPELPHCQRRDGLESRDKSLEPLGIEPQTAQADHFARERVDSRLTCEFVGSHIRQPFEKRRRQITPHVARRCRNDKVIVEQPFGGRRRWFTGSRVVCERAVHTRQHSHVLVETTKMGARAGTAAGGGESGGKSARTLLQQFDAEKLSGK